MFYCFFLSTDGLVFRMSHLGNNENLLIDFNLMNVDDQNQKNDGVELMFLEEKDKKAKSTTESMTFLCSSQPLYKLLNSETNDNQDNNNPFDTLNKQAFLSDDPFEIVENAALLSDAKSNTIRVETGMLISLDSPNSLINDAKVSLDSKTTCDTPKSSNDTRIIKQNEKQSQDSVQNTSQKQILISENVSPKSLVSPTSGKSRCKTKSTSLNLLKYSLSNSRTDLTAESGAVSDEYFSCDETQQKKPKSSPTPRRDSGTDDSFDDIWSTKPNLIDSQTDIDVDSDIDNDIAKLNIPMLTSDLKTETCLPSGRNEHETDEFIETKAFHRNELREKLASFKQKFPPSPQQGDVTTTLPIHNQTVDILTERTQLQQSSADEPITPKSQYSSVLLQQQSLLTENPNSLFEHLQKLVDQCDDKGKQTAAKHLLDDLSSILWTNNENPPKNQAKKCSPQPIKRQGTFSIEKSCDDNDGKEIPKVEDPESENTTTDAEVNVIGPDLSQVVKQIQNVIGAHQNINVLKSMDNSAPTSNPTYIVVMAQPSTDFTGEDVQNQFRSRSQSLTLKNKPLAANRVVQQKVQPTAPITPVNRPTLQRRSSFGAIIRTTPKHENESQIKPMNVVTKPDASKIVRRRSFQGPLVTKLDEPTPMQTTRPLNPTTRRRSFQAPSKIRSPPPQSNSNQCRGQMAQPRSTSTLTRRKSLVGDSEKDSPQKVKTSYGIMKKPAAPPATKNLKIRVSQTVGAGRSTAPLRAVVPMNRVASLLLINETVSSVDDTKSSSLITSTPRSIPSPSKYMKSIMLRFL